MNIAHVTDHQDVYELFGNQDASMTKDNSEIGVCVIDITKSTTLSSSQGFG